MAGKRPRDIDFPDDETIVAAVREHGSNVAAAKALGYSTAYWDKVIGERGLRDACAQARKDHGAEHGQKPKGGPKEQAEPGSEVHGDEAKVVSAPSPEPQDVPSLLRHWDLDPDEWEVRDVKVNTWNALTSDKATGDNRIVRMHQLTVFLRKKLELALVQPAVHVPELVRPRPARRVKDKARLIVVEGDHQAPYFDEGLDAAVTELVGRHQPDVHVFLGDTGDFSTISKYSDHPAADATPNECIDAAYALLRRRADAAPNAIRKKLRGNHDWRVDGEQLARSERMYGLRPATVDGHEQLAAYSLRNLLHLDALGIELIDDPRGWEHAEVELISGPRGLVVRHGWLTGAKSAERSMKKRGRSIIVGHGHDRQHVYWWDPSVEVERQAAMCGAMCLARSVRFPHFAACDDWLQGALTVTVYPDGAFVVDHARWHDGRLYWRDEVYAPRRRAAA